MNARVRTLFSCLMAATLPASVALAGPHHGGSFSRSAPARSAPQSRAGFRSAGPGVQRFNPNFATNNRINSFSRSGGWNTASINANRAAIHRPRLNANRSSLNTTGANWNRFNRNTNRFATGFNGSNRVNRAGFNRNGNWWGRHHRDCDNFFFSGFGFGFPFFSAWDYGFYPSAYYPYYPYTPYYYDPYGPSSYGYPGYPGYGGGGYPDDSGYTDPGDGSSGRYQDGRGYHRGGGQSGSTVSRVQERLAQEGYYKGSIDGLKGSRTYYAIRSYQREHNLPVDGEISDQLLQDLGIR